MRTVARQPIHSCRRPASSVASAMIRWWHTLSSRRPVVSLPGDDGVWRWTRNQPCLLVCMFLLDPWDRQFKHVASSTPLHGRRARMATTPPRTKDSGWFAKEIERACVEKICPVRLQVAQIASRCIGMKMCSIKILCAALLLLVEAAKCEAMPTVFRLSNKHQLHSITVDLMRPNYIACSILSCSATMGY